MKTGYKDMCTLSCFLQHFSQKWTNCWVGKRMGNRRIQPGWQENWWRNRSRYRFWEGSFVEQYRWKVICGTWPQDVAGRLAGRNWGWKTSKQLSGQFLLSTGKKEAQRNASRYYSWKEFHGQVGTFVRGKIEKKSLKAKTVWWLF